MERYRKLVPAVLGAVAQVVGILATAEEAGGLPESWRPWITGIIAVATALGVYVAPPNVPARTITARDTRPTSGGEW